MVAVRTLQGGTDTELIEPTEDSLTHILASTPERKEWLERLGPEGFLHWVKYWFWVKCFAVLTIAFVIICIANVFLPLGISLNPFYWITVAVVFSVICMAGMVRHIRAIGQLEARRHGYDSNWGFSLDRGVAEFDRELRKKLEKEERKRAR